MITVVNILSYHSLRVTGVSWHRTNKVSAAEPRAVIAGCMLADFSAGTVAQARNSAGMTLRDALFLNNLLVDYDHEQASVVGATSPSKIRLQNVQFRGNTEDKPKLHQVHISDASSPVDPDPAYFSDPAENVTVTQGSTGSGSGATAEHTETTASLDDLQAPPDGYTSEWLQSAQQVCDCVDRAAPPFCTQSSPQAAHKGLHFQIMLGQEHSLSDCPAACKVASLAGGERTLQCSFHSIENSPTHTLHSIVDNSYQCVQAVIMKGGKEIPDTMQHQELLTATNDPSTPINGSNPRPATTLQAFPPSQNDSTPENDPASNGSATSPPPNPTVDASSSEQSFTSAAWFIAVMSAAAAIISSAVVGALLQRWQLCKRKKAVQDRRRQSMTQHPVVPPCDGSIYRSDTMRNTFDNSSVGEPESECGIRAEPPTRPDPGDRSTESRLAYINKQLDCFGTTLLFHQRYYLQGRAGRRQGGADYD